MFRCNQQFVSTHLKHAEGMSLRYGAIVGGLFDEMGVLHVVEAGVEEADLGDYGQSEE